MAKVWVENKASGPRVIGGELLQPGEGTWVEDGAAPGLPPLRVAVNFDPVSGSLNEPRLQSIVAGSGNLLNMWTPDLALQTAALVTKEIRAAHLAFTAEYPCTHFCDPSAMVDGSGTFGSPFQIPQIPTFAKGRKNKTTLGMKRGSVYRGMLDLQSNGGVGGMTYDGGYFRIVPYGDNPRLPIISANAVRKDWNSLGDGTYGIAITGLANQGSGEVDVFQNNARLLRLLSANAVKASSGGTMFTSYSAGTLTVIIRPFSNEDPNLGQVEINAYLPNALRLGVFDDGGVSGNVQIMGLHTIGGRNTSFSVVAMGNAADGITVSGCIAGNAGVDSAVENRANDAFLFYGRDDGARMTNLTVTNNYAYNCINNAYEFSYINGALLQSCRSRNPGGASIAELWSSVSNLKARYNIGYSDPQGSIRQMGSGVAGCAFWSAGLATQSETFDSTNTKNINNEFAFNLGVDMPVRGWALVSGTGLKVHNNTFRWLRDLNVSGGMQGGYTANNYATNPTIEHSNNLYLVDGQEGASQTALCLQSYTGISGNSNYYMIGSGALSSLNQSNPKFDLASHKAAMVGGADSNCQAGQNHNGININKCALDDVGRPLVGSALRGKGVPTLTYVENGVTMQYTRDIEGKPMLLTAPTVGCYA
ncbi:hypothetical protein [Paucibacter sp. Y2R2-4]|uniref:hypothetical protein n=1 Tax=Paucibacter sp. Y2R2-4 TaxID=2893553 RepID=UPI0021E42E22|nr:hypothetical protein [Paucibacter sp. Y2R2-4]MCV2349352.1 hypothetical protein [Paucibacter sp. Y2R2-4]